MAADTSWTFEPGAIALLTVATVVYVRRWRAAGAPGIRLASFLAGILVTAIALFSPIDALGEQLFVMHMVQHVLLLDIASILLLLGLTKVILRPVTRAMQPVERA